MRKIIAIMLVAVMACMMFAGCELPEESPGELMGASTVTEATTVVTETDPTAEPTEAPTEAPAPFEVGQQVFAVYEHTGGTGIRMGFVVAFSGDDVIITAAVPGSGEEGELQQFPVGDCYTESADAWAAAGKEPLE